MKRILLAASLIACLGFAPQARTACRIVGAEPRSVAQRSAPDRAGEGDRMPTFRGISPKESVGRFREWFRDAYLREYRLYKKRNKAAYKYKEGDFQDVIVEFVIDTTGRAVLCSTRPGRLSEVQTEVLKATFEKAPLWTPAVQKGRKVKVKYTMPVRERIR